LLDGIPKQQPNEWRGGALLPVPAHGTILFLYPNDIEVAISSPVSGRQQ
jgi:hypothetical protein